VYFADNLPSTGTVARAIARRNRGAVVQHIADLWPDSVLHSGMLPGPAQKMAESLLGRWCDWVYRESAAITVLSPGFKRILVERGVPADKIDVIYNWAADEEQFFPTAPDESLRATLGLDRKFTFLYAGNLGPLQGLETVIEAAARVRDLPDVQVVFIGTGPAEAELRAHAARLGANNVRFLPRRPVEEMNAINALGDVLLVSLRDLEVMRATIPSKTQVGLASGRPLLMAVAGDGAALVEEARAGRAVPPGDAEALAAAMREMAALPSAELRAMGERGRRFYDANLSLAVGAERTDVVLRRVWEGVQARRAGRSTAR
jgi:colanic acid biosynthesis glycosyl transferase WcaI